jgi:hypothetical protein
MINRDAVAEKGNDDLAEKLKNSHDIGENRECENRGETRGENRENNNRNNYFPTSIYKYK